EPDVLVVDAAATFTTVVANVAAAPDLAGSRFAATLSLRLLPGLQAGYLLSATLIFSVVPGLTPVRALRLRTSKVPKPVRVTLLPLATSADIVANSESTVSFTAFLESFVTFATPSTRSALLTVLAFAMRALLSSCVLGQSIGHVTRARWRSALPHGGGLGYPLLR